MKTISILLYGVMHELDAAETKKLIPVVNGVHKLKKKA